jgi:hypothetical protein
MAIDGALRLYQYASLTFRNALFLDIFRSDQIEFGHGDFGQSGDEHHILLDITT